MRRTLITASIVAVGILLSACSETGETSGSSPDSSSSTAADESSPAASTAASPSPSEPAGYEALVVGDRITTAAICDNYTDILAEFTDSSNARIKSGKKYVDDPYTAARYVGNVSWVDADSEDRLSGLVDKAATSALNVVTDGQAGQVTDVAPYVADSMDACGLTKQFTTAKTKAIAVNELAADLYTEADNKPWYPKGFIEYYPDVAFKKANFNVDCYSRCWFWRYDVITKDGCPDGLYLEVQMTDSSDRVVDWTNESIQSLAPMQKARVLFKTYETTAERWDFSDVNCY